jgi:hypothetical protein
LFFIYEELHNNLARQRNTRLDSMQALFQRAAEIKKVGSRRGVRRRGHFQKIIMDLRRRKNVGQMVRQTRHPERTCLERSRKSRGKIIPYFTYFIIGFSH